MFGRRGRRGRDGCADVVTEFVEWNGLATGRTFYSGKKL